MKLKIKIDPWFFFPITILIIISLITLYSIDITYFKSQFISLIVGFVGYLIFSKINIDFLKSLKIHIYIISIILLIIVLLIGDEARGASRWIQIFGISLQFSEILKPFLAISFAAQISEYDIRGYRSFLTLLLLMIPVVILIAMQPDLGSGLLYAGVWFFALFAVGFPLTWFLTALIPLIVASPFIWLILRDYQKNRIISFMDKTSDPLGISYNSIQAIIAVGSGSYFGKGISEGPQSVLLFLPERQTDFIFATIAEGLGFFGASLAVVAFLIILARIYSLFKSYNDLFGKSILACFFGFLFIQGSVNIAMNLGLLPIVGITFPFVSFGGSSLLSNFIFLGIISSLISSQTRGKVLEIK